MISVIVPVYNAEKYLENCIKSILAQTYTDLEVICVNDGSTDNSLSILNSFADQDERIRVIDKKNSGAAAARNRGIDESRGDYITFVDSDDALDPEMYMTLMPFFEKEDVQIVHCGYRRIEQNGTMKDVTGSRRCLIQGSEEAIKCMLNGELFVGSLWNKLYRKELFKDIRLAENLRINEDVLINVRLFRRAIKTVFYDVPLYYYYNRLHSVTSNTDGIVIAGDCAQASEKIFEILKESGLSATAANRLYVSLVSLYQSYLFEGVSTHKVERALVRERISQVKPYCSGIGRRTELKYLTMLSAPHIYKLLYSTYDRIRTPNWDVKAAQSNDKKRR